MRKWITYILLLLIVGTLYLQQYNNNLAVYNIDMTVQAISKNIKIKLDKFKLSFKPDFTKMKQATVQIKVANKGGAGIIVKSDNNYLYILTAKHIVTIKGKVSLLVKDVKGKRNIIENISRKNIFIDDILDMALIKIKKPEGNFIFLSLAKRKSSIGTKIYTIGHPVSTHYTINEGIVSNYTQKSYMNKKGHYMLISAPSFSGNSGGAVVNCKTELVGMVVGIVYLKDNRNTYFLHHMSFAVKISDLKRILKE